MKQKLKKIKFKDEKGKEIKGILAMQTYLDGIVVFTKKAIYSNVSALIKEE